MKRWMIAWCTIAMVTLAWVAQQANAELPVAERSVEVHVGPARVGAAAPPFELIDSQGRLHRLADYQGTVVVLHFQSCDCPWEGGYQPILNQLVQKSTEVWASLPTAKRVQFLAVNAIASESLEQIRTYIQIAGMNYPVLKDFDSSIADAYGATTTPHIFVIDSDDQQTLVYKGGIEKSPVGPQHCGESRQQYLEPFLLAMMTQGNPQAQETPSIGGPIRQKDINPKM